MQREVSIGIKKRILILMAGFLLVIISLSVRLGYVQIIEGKSLQDRALEQHTRDRLIAPTRGIIYDRNLDVLAQSGSVATVGIVNAQIKDAETVSKILAEKLNLDYDTVYKKVTKKVAFERILTKVDKDIADQIRNLNLPGVKVDEDSKRFYPYNNLASHTLGFVGKDNQGIVGLEVKYDNYLKGAPGKILMETNGKGERRDEAAEMRINPTNGNHLVTTIDVTLQQYAEQALEKVVQMKGAKRGAIILLNPQNGEIYALANKPDFNLNEPFKINNEELLNSWSMYTEKEHQEFLNQMWRNFTINDTYEPGSTFKIFTSAMGLEEKVVTEESTFNCGGNRVIAGRTIKCWRSPRSHGTQNFVQGVQNSCNPVFMDVAERVGASKFYDFMIKFGFKSKTNIDLPGEAIGILHNKNKIGPVELATMSFGQSFQITPMQLLTGGSALVNGGYMVTPHFGKEIIDNEGKSVQVFEYEKGRQIISPETSERLKKILESVVSEGTGNKSYIPGYRIGGKTATSQKLPRGSGKYIASFLAFAPAENPVIMGLVIIDEPQGVYYGGTVAGPVMKEVLSNALPYLNIEPIYNEKELELDEVKTIKVPVFENMKLTEAKELASKQHINIQVEGNGESVKSQFPLPNEVINKTSKIILYTE
ncbi:MAG: Peptidoglycan glycosyltransferase [Clostridia bacterium]|jgi:stage V sporulation protein D (sporulation-specific penicillin-binding protein)|nr:Peptidoglycan glycosyltransferase [Clostridia bacterium]